MKDIKQFLAMTLSMIPSNNYANIPSYFDNPTVSSCLMEMYFYMLLEDEERKKEHFAKFDELYKKLTEEEQELVKQDYLNIIEGQEQNKSDESFKL